MYTVKAHDYEALARAVKSARDRPISSFVPPHMKFDFVCRRMAETLNADWKARAQAVLEERRKSGHGDVSGLLLLKPASDADDQIYISK